MINCSMRCLVVGMVGPIISGIVLQRSGSERKVFSVIQIQEILAGLWIRKRIRGKLRVSFGKEIRISTRTVGKAQPPQ